MVNYNKAKEHNAKVQEKIDAHNEEMKKKYGKDVEQQRLVMKTLAINPLMGSMFTDGQVPSVFADGLFKVREHRRAGHTKTYTAERPRFGRAHKNNIGTFWFPPTTVAKGSRKGKVTKDYEVGI